MKTSEVFLYIIEMIEAEINQNSNNIISILNKIRKLQSAYGLDLDERIENVVKEDIMYLSTDISEIINRQTELIEMYAALSAYLITLNQHPQGIPKTEAMLLDKCLKYCLKIENYPMCSTIRDARGGLERSFLTGNASL